MLPLPDTGVVIVDKKKMVLTKICFFFSSENLQSEQFVNLKFLNFFFSGPLNWNMGLFYFSGLIIIILAVKQSCDVINVFYSNICFDLFKLRYVINMWCCYFPLYVNFKAQVVFIIKYLAFSPRYLDVLVIASVFCIRQ